MYGVTCVLWIIENAMEVWRDYTYKLYNVLMGNILTVATAIVSMIKLN